MHVLVASSGNPLLEQTLLDLGHTVSLLVPSPMVADRRLSTPGAATVVGIDSWTDVGELARIVEELPHGVQRVVTIDEQAVVVCARLRDRLGLPGLPVKAALLHTDKDLSKTALEFAGIAVARHRLLRRAEQVPLAAAEFGWPVVVKPPRGAGTVSTFVIRDEGHLHELIAEGAFDRKPADSTGRFDAGELLLSLHELPAFLVEEYLPVVREYAVDLYLFRGELLAAFPAVYSAPLITALDQHQWDTALPPENPEAQKAIALALDASAILGSDTGVVHCEILRTADDWYFGEAGHRPGGGGLWQMYGRQHGLDIRTAIAQLAVGQRPDLTPRTDPPILTTLNVAAPAGGVVRSFARPEQLAALDGVLSVDLHLKTGERTPGGFGSLSLAGSIVYTTERLDQVDTAAVALIEALDLQVDAADASVGAAR
ncbi:acetyl-CoA carboxylase biotin carboxylase subunit family protein [Streptacidiphilus sp. MAP5-52]|uniref:ATP-grasp domain-containing protein n=1 Tax=Streptacidiphilus sp. MAP5-52 TaxID=3156267 RepID=UPI0035187758